MIPENKINKCIDDSLSDSYADSVLAGDKTLS